MVSESRRNKGQQYLDDIKTSSAKLAALESSVSMTEMLTSNWLLGKTLRIKFSYYVNLQFNRIASYTFSPLESQYPDHLCTVCFKSSWHYGLWWKVNFFLTGKSAQFGIFLVALFEIFSHLILTCIWSSFFFFSFLH